jgi:hypothetical protein
MATMSSISQTTIGGLAVAAAALVRGLATAGSSRRRCVPRDPIGRRGPSISARVSALTDDVLFLLPPMAR